MAHKPPTNYRFPKLHEVAAAAAAMYEVAVA
jgi:hypothetical protein